MAESCVEEVRRASGLEHVLRNVVLGSSLPGVSLNLDLLLKREVQVRVNQSQTKIPSLSYDQGAGEVKTGAIMSIQLASSAKVLQ